MFVLLPQKVTVIIFVHFFSNIFRVAVFIHMSAHSLRGIFAYMSARDLPELVRCIIYKYFPYWRRCRHLIGISEAIVTFMAPASDTCIQAGFIPTVSTVGAYQWEQQGSRSGKWEKKWLDIMKNDHLAFFTDSGSRCSCFQLRGS